MFPNAKLSHEKFKIRSFSQLVRFSYTFVSIIFYIFSSISLSHNTALKKYVKDASQVKTKYFQKRHNGVHVSIEQKLLLVEHMEKQRNLLSNKGKTSNKISSAITKQLNTLGPPKSTAAWKSSWRSMKGKVLYYIYCYTVSTVSWLSSGVWTVFAFSKTNYLNCVFFFYIFVFNSIRCLK